MFSIRSSGRVDYKNERSLSLDVIKLISAFMVVFYHFGRMNLGAFDHNGYHISVEQLCLCICSASIPMFFMVNGALMLNREYSVNKIYAKAGKLALLVFVWEFTGFPSWFLKTLTVLLLLYPIFNKIDKAEKKIWRNLLMCGLLIFPFIYNFVVVCLKCWYPSFQINIFKQSISLAVLPSRTGFFTMYSVLYFLLGGILVRCRVSNCISTLTAMLGYGLVVFDVTVSSNYSNVIQDSVNGCFPTVGALFLSFGLFNLLRNFDKVKAVGFKKVVLLLGQDVLAIYLFHMFIIRKIYGLIIPKGQYGVLTIVLLSLSVCVFCCLMNRVLRRIPLVKELVRI